MKSFFYKAGIVLFACTLTTDINAALNTGGLLQDVNDAASRPANLTFAPMVFNFDNELTTTTSVALAMGQLISAKSMGNLNPLQLPYFVSEIFAGYVRADSSRCPDLASYVTDTKAMYKAWGQAASTVQVVDRELSALASFATATPFVHGVMTNDMPVILTKFGMAQERVDAVNLLLQGLEPIITPTLCLAYASAQATAAAGQRIAQKIEEMDLMRRCCSCFGSSKPSEKLTKAAAIARSAEPFA